MTYKIELNVSMAGERPEWQDLSCCEFATALEAFEELALQRARGAQFKWPASDYRISTSDGQVIASCEAIPTRAQGLPTDNQARKDLPLWSFLMGYFPDAFVEVCKVAVAGNKQHNPGEPLHWARGKSTDQLNTAFRHLFDYGKGVKVDTDGVYHLAKAIWRLSAQLQLDVEADQGISAFSTGADPK